MAPPTCTPLSINASTTLWLGHVSVDTTQIYLHADSELKKKALARTRPQNGRTGRYQPPDTLIAWLEAL